jgi:cation diffusion facilitator family transporter
LVVRLDAAPPPAELGPVTDSPRPPNPRVRAAATSLVVGTALLAAKFWAWRLTGSQTVFSDAMESIVNVVAAGGALAAMVFASRPADESHPYGHGKIEFVTGGFEGGLVAFAAIVILHEAVAALLDLSNYAPKKLEIGIGVLAAAGVANAALGWYLLREGRRHGSATLVADGHHVLSDFWTSAGAVVGLLLVRATGLNWIDPVVAILVAGHLLVTGVTLVRHAARGLLDAADPIVVEDVANALEKARAPGVIEVHDLRAIDVGGFHHVDLHVVVPEFWPVERAHREIDEYERRAQALRERRGEMQFHVDPCERAYCRRCDWPDCPVRRAAFEARRPFTGASVARGPDPEETAAVHVDPHPHPAPG